MAMQQIGCWRLAVPGRSGCMPPAMSISDKPDKLFHHFRSDPVSHEAHLGFWRASKLENENSL